MILIILGHLKPLGFGLNYLHRKDALKLIHVAYRGDTAHVTAESFWIWHPTRQQIHYYSINIRGDFLEGEVFFSEENIFITQTEGHLSDGKIAIHRDQNIMVSDNVHKTISAGYKNGEWIDDTGFTWKRLNDKFDKITIKY